MHVRLGVDSSVVILVRTDSAVAFDKNKILL